LGRKLPTTPRSRVRSALRQVWLRSRERQAAIKRDRYTCQSCGRKRSVAKGLEFDVGVHHKQGIGNWEKVIDAVFEEILCDPKFLETLCQECHDDPTKNTRIPQAIQETVSAVPASRPGRENKAVHKRALKNEAPVQQLRFPTLVEKGS
jgi:5-methylcytosine-specific restriction endonuclease McrA